ncbi:MAG: fatty acid desaturase family protein [Pseudomonadota bacterium]
MTASLSPKSLFSPEEWEQLTKPVTWQGPALVLHAWAIIAGVMALIAWSGYHPLVVIPAIMVIGARQLGLAILMHEAAHGLLSRNKAVNDFLGQWPTASPVGADLTGYRPYHLSHHRFVQSEKDPDLGLAAPFPVTKASLARKIFRDLTAQTFLKQRLFAMTALLPQNKVDEVSGGTIVASRNGLGRFFLTNGIIFAALTAVGQPWLYLVGWLLPLATWFPLATRIRNIGEHACVDTDLDDPLTHARTTHTNFIERQILAPYWVAYHAEHHLVMYVPCFRLPLAHRMLQDKKKLGRTDIQPSYLSVLRRVTTAAAA